MKKARIINNSEFKPGQGFTASRIHSLTFQHHQSDGFILTGGSQELPVRTDGHMIYRGRMPLLYNGFNNILRQI